MRRYYVIDIAHSKKIDSNKLHEELSAFANNNIVAFSIGTIVFGDAPEEEIQRILTICEGYGEATLKRDRAA